MRHDPVGRMILWLPLMALGLLLFAVGGFAAYAMSDHYIVDASELVNHFREKDRTFEPINVATGSFFMSVISVYSAVTMGIAGNVVNRTGLSFRIFLSYFVRTRFQLRVLLILIPVTILLINFVVTFSMHRYVYLAAVCLLFFSLMSITSFLFLVLSIDDRGRAVALLADSILRRHSATEELVLGVQDIVLDLAADDARRLLAEVATHPDLVGHEELALSILLTALEIGGTR